MDGYINSSIEQQTIYDIYRACRLCGAGAGYKMPIIQNVVHLDNSEVELRQKIRECVQIEVHLEDKMPPLICELCVDKVNDFYEFLEMCRQTNKRTRLRLGLPPQTMPRGAPDAGDCILGVTEPVYLNEDSNESLLKPRQRSKGRFVKRKEVRKAKSKEAVFSEPVPASSPRPPRLRANKRRGADEELHATLQITSRRKCVTAPRSILRRDEVKCEDESAGRSKRMRESRDRVASKRVKIVDAEPSKTEYKCNTCRAVCSSARALDNHAKTHSQKQKKAINCVSCSKCEKQFPNKAIMYKHRCPAAAMYKCSNCGRCISNARNLSRHETACYSKNEFKVSSTLHHQLQPVRVRLQAVDALLQSIWNGSAYDVSSLPADYGVSKDQRYPLMSQRVKQEPGYMVMVNIHDSIDGLDISQDYVHWDSDSTYSDLDVNDTRAVGTLATLSLKTIFSHKFLGKVPRKKRTVKAMDSHFDSDNLGIDNIINSLSNDKKDDNDSLFGDDKPPVVSNEDFDSLFNNSGKKHNDVSEINKLCDDKNDNKTDINDVNITDSNDAKRATDSESSAAQIPDSGVENNEESSSENIKDEEKVTVDGERAQKVVMGNGTDNNISDRNKTTDKSEAEPDNDRDPMNTQSNSGKCNTSVDMMKMKTDTTVGNDSEDSTLEYVEENIIKNNINNDSQGSDSIDTNIVMKTNNDNGDENNTQSNDSNDAKTDDTRTKEMDTSDVKDITLEDLNETSTSDIDDKSLMEALDEQIGEKTDDVRVTDEDSVNVINNAE